MPKVTRSLLVGNVLVPGTSNCRCHDLVGADLHDRWIVCRNQNVKCVLSSTGRLCGRCQGTRTPLELLKTTTNISSWNRFATQHYCLFFNSFVTSSSNALRESSSSAMSWKSARAFSTLFTTPLKRNFDLTRSSLLLL
jgi:hypothetical protein